MSTMKLVDLLRETKPSLREELNSLGTIENLDDINNIFSKFFLGNKSIESYKKELTLSEVSIFNSILKLINVQQELLSTVSISPMQQSKEADRECTNNDYSSIGKVAGATLIGGVVGGVLASMSWGCVLFSVAGCAIGTYFTNQRATRVQARKNPQPTKRKSVTINVDKLLGVFENLCISIDELIDDYNVSINNIKATYESRTQPTLASQYKTLVDAIAQLYVSRYNCHETLPESVDFAINFILRTLKNYHCEIVPFEENSDAYTVEASKDYKFGELIHAAIVEKGELLEQGEFIKPLS